MEKILIYKDEKHETKTRAELDTSRVTLQDLLDEWNKQELTTCTDIFPLMMNPQKVYGEAVKSVADIPISHGKFQINKDKFLEIMDVPTPNDLYVKARTARQTPFAAHRELWSIKDNLIVMDQAVADGFIYCRNIYAENERQKEFAQAVINHKKSSDTLINILTNLPGNGLHVLFPFIRTGGNHQLLPELEIEYVMFGEIMKRL